MPGSETPSLPLLLAAGLLLVNQAPAARGAPADSLQLLEPTPLVAEAYSVAPNCVPAWLIDASGIRRLPDRCGAATEPAASTAAAALLQLPATSLAAQSTERAAASAPVPARASARGKARKPRAGQDCSDPFWLDARGIRRLRPGCL
jgi:hypothetical protein